MEVEKIRLRDLTDRGLLTESSVNRIKPYLSRVEKGYPIDVRTPFWNNEPRLDVINRWLNLLFDENILPEIDTLELKQVDKIGPLSIQSPLAERFPQIQEYWKRVNYSADETAVTAAIERTLQELGVPLNRLRPLSYDNAAKKMENSTNSGLPSFTKRIEARSTDLMYALNGSYLNFPAVLGWRGQSSGLTTLPKQRTVWMFPQSTNIVEASLFSPTHDMIKARLPFAAWIGPDRVDEVVTDIIDSGYTIFSTDFSSYDQSLQKELQSWYFRILKSLFQSSAHRDIEDLEYNFSNISLLLSEEELARGTHGVPSGSQLTNQLDSIVHRVAQHYVCLINGTELDLRSQVQGDDGLLISRGLDDVNLIATAYSELGLEFNPDKQEVSSTQVNYLQRLHTSNWRIDGKTVGVYPFSRALNSLLGSERWRNKDEWPPEFWSIRAIMILENCKNHPIFEKVVEFSAKGDKYDLGRKFPGGLKRMLSKKNVSDFVSQPGAYASYNQQRIRTSIFDFKTVRYLLGT